MTPEQRSNAMRRVKLKNGPLEQIIQKALKKKRLQFRCHVKNLPGSPDIVFPKSKLAIFVDGDFWHGWQLPAWQHKLSDFWLKKIQANQQRDQRNFRRLRHAGWRVIRLWEHQIKANLEGCLRKVVAAMEAQSKAKPSKLLRVADDDLTRRKHQGRVPKRNSSPVKSPIAR